MAILVTVELSISVRDEAQADLILEAVDSGLAETAIKDRVLYGGASPREYVGTVQASPAVSKAKAEESSMKIRPVESKVKSPVPVVEPVREERARGVLGRRQINRTGRK